MSAPASRPPRPPVFSAATVEAVCRVLADSVTGSQIPNLIAPLKVGEAAQDATNTKWKRLFNAVATAQNRQRDGFPLLRLVLEVMKPVRFESQAAFDHRRSFLNERLLLAGFHVAEDGSLERVRAAPTIGEAQRRADDLRAELTRREVHPEVIRFCRAELLQKNYFHAVLEASKSLFDRLRAMTGVSGDGSALIDAACSGQHPLVAFNELTTDSHRSEQAGLATLMKGLYSTFRTPPAHAPRIQWAISRADALDMFTLASMLHRRLDGATVRQRP